MANMILRIVLLTGVLCLAAGRAALAQDKPTNDFYDMTLFSLSKRTEDAFDAPAAVYVVSAEDIRRSGASNLPDVLRMVPGIQVAQQNAHTWSISARGFGTQFTNKLLVIVDGRVVYKPLFSGVFWDVEQVPLELIDRIEVIRGPGGTIWGSNAVNGIINIITKAASATQGTHFASELGARGRKSATFTNGGASGEDNHYRVYAHAAENPEEKLVSNGTGANDEWNTSDVGFRYDVNKSGGDSVSIHGDFKNAESKNYFSVLPSTTSPFTTLHSEDKSQQSGNIVVKWDSKIDARSSTQTQIYFDYDHAEAGLVDWTGYTFDSDFQYDTQWNDAHQLTTGLGFRYMIEEQENPSSYIRYRNANRRDPLYSAFLQDKIRLAPDALYLTLGSKLEHNNFTGFEYQPSARLAYYPDDSQTLWASVTRAVRSPSIGEEDATVKIAGTPGGFVARSYEDGYQSETLVAYELGYRTVPNPQWLMEGTLFYNDYDQLRTGELGTAFDDISTPLVTRNNGFGETYGVEVNTKFQAQQNWRLQASYTYMNMSLHLEPGVTDSSFAVQELQTPSQQFSIGSYYNIRPDIEFDNSIYYVGKTVALTKSQPIGEYVRMDSRISWHVTDAVELSLVGQNLLDARHQEYQPALYSRPEQIGRTVYAKISADF